MTATSDILRSLNESELLGEVRLGAALERTGILKFFNSSSANATGFQAGNASASLTYTLPTAGPAANDYVLGSSTAGVLAWINTAGTYAPLAATYVTLSTNATLTNERVLTGTANQITVTDNGAGGTVVLSTPQNIHSAATPTFGGMTLTMASLDDTNYSPLLMNAGAGSGQSFASLYSTTSVTVAKQIATSQGHASIILVHGTDGTNAFTDMLLNAPSTTPNVVSALTTAGAPAARTYSASGSDVRVAMASGTYSVRTLQFSINTR